MRLTAGIGVRAAAAAMLTAGVIATVASPVDATAGPTSHHSSLDLTAVSCLTAHQCIAVGATSIDRGKIVVLHNGVPGHVSTVHGSEAYLGISCPSSKGCVALGTSQFSLNPLIVTIGKSGKPLHSALPAVPSGVSMAGISCTTTHHCVLVGSSFLSHPNTFVVATWNGHHLTTHSIRGVGKHGDLASDAIGCHGSRCVVVAEFDGPGTTTGIVVPIHDGHPGTIRKVHGTALTSVACATSSRCYAVGTRDGSSVVVHLHNGTVTASTSVPGRLLAIACHGELCTAVGSIPPPPAPHLPSTVGLVVSLSSGSIRTTQTVSISSEFVGVSRPTTATFVAVGTALKKGSQITLG